MEPSTSSHDLSDDVLGDAAGMLHERYFFSILVCNSGIVINPAVPYHG
jgi:hypothetical protein